MIELKTFKGVVKMFNGTYGFIESELGDTYFHKSGLNTLSNVEVGFKVKFSLEKSNLKKDSFQAIQIQIIQEEINSLNQTDIGTPEKIGKIEWFDQKGFGVITSNSNEYFFHVSSVDKKPESIEKNDLCFFNTQPSKKRLGEDATNVIFLKNQSLTEGLETNINQRIESIGIINNKSKYEQLTILLNVLKSNNKLLPLHKIEVGEFYKYMLWLEGYSQEVDLEFVSKRMSELKLNEYHTIFTKIFKRLNVESYQKLVLNNFLSNLGYIDDIDRENKIKAILGMSEDVLIIDRTELFTFINNKSDNEIKYKLWLEGFIQEINLVFVSKKMTEMSIENCIGDYRKIFNRLNNESMQLMILDEFLKKLGVLEHFEDYERIKAILNLDKGISDNCKSFFLNSVSEKCDDSWKYLLWLQVAFRINALYFEKGLWSNEKKWEIGNFNYQFLNSLLEKYGIPSNFKYSPEHQVCLENEVFSASNSLLKKDEKINLLYDVYCHLFNNINHKFDLLNWILDSLSEFDISARLHFLYKVTEILLAKPTKNKFMDVPLINFLGINHPNEIPYVDKNLFLFPDKFHQEILSFYKIEKRNKTKKYSHSWRYNKTISILKAIIQYEKFSENQILEYYKNEIPSDYIKELTHLAAYKKIKEILFNNVQSNFIVNIVEIILPISQSVRLGLINSQSEDILFNIYKYSNYLSKETTQRILDKEFENLSISMKLKLWIHNISEYFDFNNFCNYYFILNQIERSLFNRKVKETQGEALKQSMLKQREPWRLDNNDGENSLTVYSATWKSIWFKEGSISFCCDNDSTFSKPYAWDFSEEKFNLLFDYISGRRLSDLIVHVKNDFIVNVIGLEELEEVIWKVQIQREIERGEGIRAKSEQCSRIPVNIILRNQCIQLLNRLQLAGLEPTRILENTVNILTGHALIDISLLYSIPLNKNEIALIWESLELDKSKATHIFKCAVDEYKNILHDVEFYLQSRTKVRSSLNSSDSENVTRQRELRYFCRIDHDNFDYSKWKNNLFCALPELKGLE